MLRDLNRFLRKVLAAFAVAAILLDLLKGNETRKNENNKEGYQSEEFDDIW